ncbi:hypothetical protein V5F33_08975 [Xanthobacter tagetidis]|uniref:DUF2961 domain-containing protein n=2 Tax=Xanthobacter tagetidis TaxID=60216 RepID=A0A3L7AE27_9HYPH|nr:hypothetical protein [Xanthobacter tagetidis]RLP78649.1 hypothetical protein D9R14_10295 [Xanthobacter tagetidis]
MRCLLPLVPLLLLASPAVAKAPGRPQPPPLVIACKDAFAKTASHRGLVRAYGAGNVTFETVNRPGGEVAKATVLFAKEPQRRVEIEWYDLKRRRLASTITVFGEDNQWSGPLGLRNGMTIAELEQRAGKPFRINGFGFDVAGAGHFEDTALADLPGGCGFDGYFEIEGGLPPDHLSRFIGEVEIPSNDPDLMTLKPRLWMYTLTYPSPNAE